MKARIIILTLLAMLTGGASFGQMTMYNPKISKKKKVANYILNNFRLPSETRSTSTRSTTTKNTNKTIAYWVKTYNAAFKNCYFTNNSSFCGEESDFVFGPANASGKGKGVHVLPASDRSVHFTYNIIADGRIELHTEIETAKRFWGMESIRALWGYDPSGFYLEGQGEHDFHQTKKNAQKYTEFLNWRENSGNYKRSETADSVKIAPELDPTFVYEETNDSLEQKPAFTGGDAAMTKYLANTVKYPAIAQENGVEGQVMVSAIVEPDGSLSDFKIAKSVDPSLDREALRVVKTMPKWEPGKRKEKAVRVRTSIPVTFRLN